MVLRPFKHIFVTSTMNISATPVAPRGGYVSLLAWIIFTFAFAALGAMGSSDAPSFYAQLQQPGWAPPSSVFGPVWSALYLLMAIAVWRYWRKSDGMSDPGAWLYVVQLGVNSLWSWLFFKWHQGFLSFLCIVIMWLLIAATIFVFGKRDKLASVLLWPYLAWVSFAAVLCYHMWQLNPALLG